MVQSYSGEKELVSLEECLRKGLLRRILSSKENAKKGLEKAKRMLKESKESLNSKRLISATVISYLSMFNAARALLLMDGFREKSHACVVRYIEDKYAQSGKIPSELIELFDRFRSSRHASQYNVDYYPSGEEATEMVEYAEKFILIVEKLLEKG